MASESDAHVKITWDYGDHGDGYPFFGPGGSLAHAFYPTKGKVGTCPYRDAVNSLMQLCRLLLSHPSAIFYYSFKLYLFVELLVIDRKFSFF